MPARQTSVSFPLLDSWRSWDGRRGYWTLIFCSALSSIATIGSGSGAYPSSFANFCPVGQGPPNVQINYQPLGSGAGIGQPTSRTVFFGVTIGPMTNDQLLAAPAKILHLPTVLGAVVQRVQQGARRRQRSPRQCSELHDTSAVRPEPSV